MNRLQATVDALERELELRQSGASQSRAASVGAVVPPVYPSAYPPAYAYSDPMYGYAAPMNMAAMQMRETAMQMRRAHAMALVEGIRSAADVAAIFADSVTVRNNPATKASSMMMSRDLPWDMRAAAMDAMYYASSIPARMSAEYARSMWPAQAAPGYRVSVANVPVPGGTVAETHVTKTKKES